MSRIRTAVSAHRSEPEAIRGVVLLAGLLGSLGAIGTVTLMTRRCRASSRLVLAGVTILAAIASLAGIAAPAGAVSVAQVGRSMVIAAEGCGGSLYSYRQPAGALGWTKQQVAPPGTIASAPSVAHAGTSTVIAAEGTGGSLLVWSRPTPVSSWTKQQVAPPGAIVSAPSIAQVGQSTEIAAEGHHGFLYGSLDVWSQPITGGSWAGQQVAPPLTITSAPSIAQVGQSPVIAAEGLSGSLLSWSQPTASGWTKQQVAPPGTIASAPSVAPAGQSAVIAAQAPGNSLDFWSAPTVGSSWSYQHINSSVAFGPPTVAQAGQFTVIAVAGAPFEGAYWDLDYWYKPIGSTNNWLDQRPAADSIIGQPSIAQFGPRTVIAAQTPNHNLGLWSQTTGAGPSGWTAEPVDTGGTTCG